MSRISGPDSGEEAAERWFSSAAAEGGALHSVIKDAVRAAIKADSGEPGSAVAAVLAPAQQAVSDVQTAVAAFTSKLDVEIAVSLATVEQKIAQLEPRVRALEELGASKIRNDLDTKYSWLKEERTCDPVEWAFGWRKFKVDKDFLESLGDQMLDPAALNATLLTIQHPDNVKAKVLQTTIALKNAPRASWKKLCLKAHGGSPEVFKAFVSEKAASDDRVIAAIAKKILAMYCQLELQYVDVPSSKAATAEKNAAQKGELMPLIYASIKVMKRRALKASARKGLGAELLMREFGLDKALATTRLAAAPFSAKPLPGIQSAFANSTSVHGATVPSKRLRADPSAQASASGSVFPPPPPAPAQPRYQGKGAPQALNASKTKKPKSPMYQTTEQ